MTDDQSRPGEEGSPTRRAICEIGELPPGHAKTVELEGFTALTVCNVDGTYYAVQDLCSHGEASLGDGKLLGCEIECPLHKGRFDVITGLATRRPAKKSIQAYACYEEDGHIYVETAARSVVSSVSN